jgi:kynureninase
VTDDLIARATALDAADPLAVYREQFLAPDGFDVVAYLDGNSLGRPLKATAALMETFIRESWGGRLIRGWTDEWMEWPLRLGDRLGRVAIGAADGQTVIADSTTVLIYKLARAAVAARPGRDRIVLDTDNFPTDRYVLEGIAAERGLELVWIETDPATGIHPGQVAEVVDERTALVLFSHVAYRSGWLADVPEITRIAHDAGALAMWDLCHSVGSVPVELDRWDVDLAVGCTYKYLNGGPGAPAFAYAKKDLLPALRQPIQGWMGHRASFEMGPGFEPAEGSRALISGTPPILAMVPAAREPRHAGIRRHRCGAGEVAAAHRVRAGHRRRAAGAVRRRGGQPPRPAAPRRAPHPAQAGLREAARPALGRRRDPRLPAAGWAADRAGPAEHQLRRGVPGPVGAAVAAREVTGYLLAGSLWWDGRLRTGYGLRLDPPLPVAADDIPGISEMSDTRRLPGTLLPGLVDAHVHSGLVDLATVRAGASPGSGISAAFPPTWRRWPPQPDGGFPASAMPDRF